MSISRCNGVCDHCTREFCVGFVKDDPETKSNENLSNENLSNLDEDEIFDPYYFSYGMHW